MTAMCTRGTADGGGGVRESVGFTAKLLLLAASAATTGLVVVAAVGVYTQPVHQTVEVVSGFWLNHYVNRGVGH